LNRFEPNLSIFIALGAAPAAAKKLGRERMFKSKKAIELPKFKSPKTLTGIRRKFYNLDRNFTIISPFIKTIMCNSFTSPTGQPYQIMQTKQPKIQF
jgi:hypothetical protein